MSRLLFAAARGARIEMRVFNEYHWRNAYNLDLNKGSAASDWVYRIHPDDAHLQYGPISTALRDCDFDFQWFYIDAEQMHDFVIRCAIFANYANNMMYEWQQNKDRLTRSLFLLLLAEALADEGM